MPDISINPVTEQNLYVTENYIDTVAGFLTKHTPVLKSGMQDPMREVWWAGATTLMTPQGQRQITFKIEGAKTLEEAIDGFPAACMALIQGMLDEGLRRKLVAPVSPLDLSKIKN